MSTKVSRPVLRGPDPSHGAWLLGDKLPPEMQSVHLVRKHDNRDKELAIEFYSYLSATIGSTLLVR
jgi:hypothetical protein